ncbi:MAG TPA: CPBP family intramembrane glutamic endopeptidase [Symbiobacteriaceae bacterium]|nr:CPBP family intramembrane glutamic endopeptidase [Symbiobacteriaceae bacterium]
MNGIQVSTPAPEERPTLKLWWAVILHLLPGAMITLFYVLTAPVFLRANVPPMVAFYLAILVVLVPIELGFLLLLGKRRNGRFSLDGIILNREATPLRQYYWLVPVLLIWGILVFIRIGVPLDQFVTNRFLFWLPALFQPPGLAATTTGVAGYSRAVLLAGWTAALLLNGFLGPLVEEYYFRGYLLPRMTALGRWAPLVNTVLFSLYHFFSPWQNVSRILAWLPLVYVVWWKRNLRIAIATHWMLNVGYMMMLLPELLRAG